MITRSRYCDSGCYSAHGFGVARHAIAPDRTAPYEQELELEAREGGDDCETVEECVGGAIGFIGGIVGQDTCAEVEVPCPGSVILRTSVCVRA